MLFLPSSVVACVAIRVYGIPVEKIRCMSDDPRHDGMLACEVDVVAIFKL